MVSEQKQQIRSSSCRNQVFKFGSMYSVLDNSFSSAASKLRDLEIVVTAHPYMQTGVIHCKPASAQKRPRLMSHAFEPPLIVPSPD